MKCLRCDCELRRMILRTRANFTDDSSFWAGLRTEILDDDTVYLTNPPVEPLDFGVQVHSGLDAYVCPQCGHVELVAARLDTLFPEKPALRICPHCGKEVTATEDAPDICPSCGRNFHEPIPGRKYIRPKNF